MPLNWISYPRSRPACEVSLEVVSVFESAIDAVDSESHELSSNQVLAVVRPGLEAIGFLVETGKKRTEKIRVPVLYGTNGDVEKSFEADAFDADSGFVLEVEAGRAFRNNQFLKDLFQACMMSGVRHVGIAVRNTYSGGGTTSRDFLEISKYFETLYSSERLELPLDSVLLLGS